MARHSSHILEMARKGAEHAYDELKAQMAQLVKNFPHLADRARTRARATSRTRAARGGKAVSAAGTELGSPTRTRKRRRMSAAARQAVSARMKKYWATKRAGKK